MSVAMKLTRQSSRSSVKWYRVVAAGRMFLGTSMMFFPRISGGLWLGSNWAIQPVARYHTRINGGRETALGISLLSAADNAAVMHRLLWVAAIFDFWDACTALFVGRCLDSGHRQRQAVLAPAIWVVLSVMATRQVKNVNFR